MSSSTISAFDAARLRIAHLELGEPRDLEPAVQRAVAISGRSLGVERVGVWVLSADRRSLAPLYVTGRPESNGKYHELPLSAWPLYAAAIDERRVIAVHDARADPRTRELADEYLIPLDITSMLDAPIFLRGQVWGILCHEHDGEPRIWKQTEIDFAISVADMLSTLFEQAARLAAERELRRRDAEASRRRKNEALVQMGAGVAHDFGNVLQTISLLAERAARVEPADALPPLELIGEECARGQRMVAQLLDFARSTPRPPLPVDLTSMVRDLASSLEALLGERVTLSTKLGDEVLVPGNLAQLERVVQNLVVNAREAMPKGGMIRVEVWREGLYGAFSVADEGRGIPAELRERIFEPFFTTRLGAGGTGLGLATVTLIVEQHGGHIDMVTGDTGTTFTIHLPLAEPPIELPKP